ncbi:hypothetical protein QVD17_41487 [Tagetes erecta]|uniref:Protein kinase domain-containing protein n=1 Tax=Tagetes erecta TaxID=13708 RepID=A0AAD8JMT2_TARER|nr:hypothetical protein QVD17_41487 [Tagetes erecta]
MGDHPGKASPGQPKANPLALMHSGNTRHNDNFKLQVNNRVQSGSKLLVVNQILDAGNIPLALPIDIRQEPPFVPSITAEELKSDALDHLAKLSDPSLLINLAKAEQLKHQASFLHKVSMKAVQLESNSSSKVKTIIPKKLVTEESSKIIDAPKMPQHKTSITQFRNQEVKNEDHLAGPFSNKEKTVVTHKDVAIVVRQVVKVAAECHLHGLVHRDMKSEKYTDVVGSVYYVAPEVLMLKSGEEISNIEFLQI